MGDDYRNHQVYAHGEAQSQVVNFVRQHVLDQGYSPSEFADLCGRSIAVCCNCDWVTLLDSAGTDWDDIDEFKQLTEALSLRWPVVDVEMSDSAALTLSLHSEGKMIDRYQNLRPPFFAFDSEEEAQRVKGDSLVWSRLLNVSSATLRSIWRQGIGSGADEILQKTGEVLRWHPLLCHVGYTIDYDGCPVDFEEHYSENLGQLSGVERFHFQKKGS